MQQQELIPHLFRTEYRKIIAVLCRQFGMEQIEVAEDIASQTFLTASETWGIKGLPENPTAWLYVAAKNKAKDHLKRNDLFQKKIAPQIKNSSSSELQETDIDLSEKNIQDSQLQMMFAVCHPSISSESQIGLALRILCGFGIEEIANAFLSNKETIGKRLTRAKEKLKLEKVKIEFPGENEISNRLENVLTTLYLLFNEGYYSAAKDKVVRKELCLEAMRLAHLLTENENTDLPQVNALLSLMCFHASRLEARTNDDGEIILYKDQNTDLWNKELIRQGEYFLNTAAKGNKLSKYHLEAAIAYRHTQKEDTVEKWETILQLYNHLLQIQYSPAAALNRAYAISKARSKNEAIKEAEKLDLTGNHLYYSLLADLYTNIDDEKALHHFQQALLLSKSAADKKLISENIRHLKMK